jgi:MbtH protein
MSSSSQPNGSAIDGELFQVLMNAQEQHSLWPAALAAPEGWRRVGPIGAKAECLAYVDAHWVDMRPKSLRDSMATIIRNG